MVGFAYYNIYIRACITHGLAAGTRDPSIRLECRNRYALIECTVRDRHACLARARLCAVALQAHTTSGIITYLMDVIRIRAARLIRFTYYIIIIYDRYYHSFLVWARVRV